MNRLVACIASFLITTIVVLEVKSTDDQILPHRNEYVVLACDGRFGGVFTVEIVGREILASETCISRQVNNL